MTTSANRYRTNSQGEICNLVSAYLRLARLPIYIGQVGTVPAVSQAEKNLGATLKLNRLTKSSNIRVLGPISLFAAACVFSMTLGIEKTLADPLAGIDRGTKLQMSKLDRRSAITDADFDEEYKLDIGDKLKITIYGREDLSGEYQINEQGLLRIPTMGSFKGAGNATPEIRQSLLNVVEQAQHRRSDVTIDVLERRPIYVTGLVANPGSYPFSIGMTVLHAVAVAGGSAASALKSWLPIEGLRDVSRIRTAKEELKRLLAREARLLTEEADKTKIATPPQMIKLLGKAIADDLIRREQEVLDRQHRSLERERESHKAAIEETRKEIEAFEKELEKIRYQVELRETRVKKLKSLADRGLASGQRLSDSQVLLASADRDTQNALAAIARGRRTLQRAHRDLAMVTLDRKLKIEEDLRSINEELAKIKERIAGSERIVEKISRMPSGILSMEQAVSYEYEVMRRGTDGQQNFISVTETTSLRPGDVLRIKAQKIE